MASESPGNWGRILTAKAGGPQNVLKLVWLVSWFGRHGVYGPFSDGRVEFIVHCLCSEASVTQCNLLVLPLGGHLRPLSTTELLAPRAL